jgi:hypothetical protein
MAPVCSKNLVFPPFEWSLNCRTHLLHMFCCLKWSPDVLLFVQAYVTIDGIPRDVLIDGSAAQNRAVSLFSSLELLAR